MSLNRILGAYNICSYVYLITKGFDDKQRQKKRKMKSIMAWKLTVNINRVHETDDTSDNKT